MKIHRLVGQQNLIDNQKQVSSKGTGARGIIRTLSNPDSLAATILLESFVTGGRGINEYKRSGFPGFRERFTDDVISAVFWMKGVDMFNALGNKFGKYILKLPTTEFDVGKDALRNPFGNLINDLSQTYTDEKALKAVEKKLAVFKSSKSILATLLAVGFVGFALPKINQAITKKIMGGKSSKNDDNKTNKVHNNSVNTIEKQMLKAFSIEEFERQINMTDTPSFKGLSPEMLTKVSYYLENNKICKMLSCDTGILSGRVITARNPDEGAEYFFRDSSSSFFYFASTPLIYMFLQKITKSANLTDIDPVAAKQIHKNLLSQLKNSDGTFASMNVKEFASKTIGTLDDKALELLNNLPFNSDVISFNELKKYITDEKLLQKASNMAKLQPEQAGIGKVLTRQQVGDVLKNGSINTPEFMQKIFTDKFGESLSNPYKYIPMKKITTFRTNIDKYAQAVIDTANKKNGGVVDKKLLDKLNAKSFAMSALFRAIAIGISAFALGVLIPKLQYAMTERRTGTNSAPGLREYRNEEHQTKNNKEQKKENTKAA